MCPNLRMGIADVSVFRMNQIQYMHVSCTRGIIMQEITVFNDLAGTHNLMALDFFFFLQKRMGKYIQGVKM